MTDINPPHINRRRMLSITATTVAGLAAGALASSGPAQAAPSLCDLPGTGSVGPLVCGVPGPRDPTICGDYNDNVKAARLYLWEQVKDVTPAAKGTNQEVVVTKSLMEPQPEPKPPPKPPAPAPGPFYQGHAIRWGSQWEVQQDRLFIPTQRVRGIECDITWQPSTLNYFNLAWEEAVTAPLKPGQVHAIGINSAEKRTQDQLHIHLSILVDQAVLDLATAWKNHEVAQSQDTWPTKFAKINFRWCRVLWRPNLDQNVFALLHADIATTDMQKQMLVITEAPHGGFYIINSQAEMPNQLVGGASCDPYLVYL